jgi:HlyD family secretion protein
MKRIVVLVGIAILLVALIGLSLRPRRIPVQAAAVSQGDIRAFVDEQGTTRLPQDYLVTMPFDGRIEAIELEDGDEVKRNQVVARISTADLALEMAQAKAEVARLEAVVRKSEDDSVEHLAMEQAKLFDESMEATVAAAEQQVLAGNARQQYARTQFGRVEELYRSGAQTQNDFDQAKLSVDEREYESSQNTLVLAALKAMKRATELLPQLMAEYIGRREFDAAVTRRQREEADVRYRQAQLRGERGEMKSPVNGVVLSKEVSNERFLTAGTVLLRIGQLEQLEIETDVLSEDAVDLRVGDPVEIYGPAVAASEGDGLSGVVHRVAPSGFTKISSLGVEQQRVRVIIRFSESTLAGVRERVPLGEGYRVRVRVFTDEHRATLVVPRSALFRGASGDWQVFVIRSQRVQQQTVEIGILTDDRAEIIDGLVAGELVVLAPESALRIGDAVSFEVRE